MKLNFEFYLILVLCLLFASIFLYNGFKIMNREGMDNAEKAVVQPTKKKITTVSPK